VLEFVSRHGHEIRYVSDAGWFRFNGQYWERDKTRVVQDLMRICNRDMAAMAVDKRLARTIGAAKTCAAVEAAGPCRPAWRPWSSSTLIRGCSTRRTRRST
jgi:D5 N terminal like